MSLAEPEPRSRSDQDADEEAAFQRRMLVEAEEARRSSEVDDELDRFRVDRSTFRKRAMRVIFAAIAMGSAIATVYSAGGVVHGSEPASELWEWAVFLAILVSVLRVLQTTKRELTLGFMLAAVVAAIGWLAA